MVSWDEKIEQERFISNILRDWNSSSTWYTTEINISCVYCLPNQDTTLRQFTIQRILMEQECLGWTTLQSWTPHAKKKKKKIRKPSSRENRWFSQSYFGGLLVWLGGNRQIVGSNRCQESPPCSGSNFSYNSIGDSQIDLRVLGDKAAYGILI